MDPLYTYQGRRKLELAHRPSTFVSRAEPDCLRAKGFGVVRALSPHSFLIQSDPETLQIDITRAREIGPSHYAYVIKSTGDDYLVTDRLFIRFRTQGIDHAAFARKYNLLPLETYSSYGGLFQIGRDADPITVVCFITENDSLVDTVDHDRNIMLRLASLPSDPQAARQWYLFSESGDSLITAHGLTQCDEAWKLLGSYGSRDMVIGVADCGCDLDDPDFEIDKFAGWACFLDGRFYMGEQPQPQFLDLMRPKAYHGTLSATLAAADVNGKGGIGAAPGCSLLPLKWDEATFTGELTTTYSRIMTAIESLRNHVDIMSNAWSLDPPRYFPPDLCDRIAMSAISGGKHGNGIVWIMSAGNDNVPVHYRTSAPIPWQVRMPYGVPVITRRCNFENSLAGIPGVVHVGAISSLSQRCHYSNYGTGLDIVAPSTNTHLYGRGRVRGAEFVAPYNGTRSISHGGTSAATSLVAGVAGLVRSANPALTALEVISILKETADKDLLMDGYDRSHQEGDREPNWDVSPVPPFDSGEFRDIKHPQGLWSPWFGFGKVNARRAVAAALRRHGHRA